MLRIGIDATLLRPDRLTGIERYALSLLQELAELAPREIVIFTRPDAPAAVRALPFERYVAPLRGRVAVDQAWLPLAAYRARVDLLHTLAFPTPVLWRGPAVVTVHDATPWLHPEALSTGMRYYYGPLYPQALARAAAILTVSRASREDLVRSVGVSPERIHVTPNGIEPRFLAARPRDAVRGRYLLAVGTVEPRKNYPALLSALRILRREGRELDLVIVGRQGWGGPLQLGELAPHVRLAGPVPDSTLPGLYAGATCFVQPSLYEGFGLALGEAMAAGAPAVAAGIPALREVGGDTVLYADPRDPVALAARIREVLDDPSAAIRRALAARDRARRFRWETCAATTLEVYREVVARHARAAAAG